MLRLFGQRLVKLRPFPDLLQILMNGSGYSMLAQNLLRQHAEAMEMGLHELTKV